MEIRPRRSIRARDAHRLREENAFLDEREGLEKGRDERDVPIVLACFF